MQNAKVYVQPPIDPVFKFLRNYANRVSVTKNNITGVYTLKMGNKANVTFRLKNRVLYIGNRIIGRTHPGHRSKGYGTFLRALVTAVGSKVANKAVHVGQNLNSKRRGIPNSTYIMTHRLGYKLPAVKTTSNYVSTFNYSKNSMNKALDYIRMHHKYLKNRNFKNLNRTKLANSRFAKEYIRLYGPQR